MMRCASVEPMPGSESSAAASAVLMLMRVVEEAVEAEAEETAAAVLIAAEETAAEALALETYADELPVWVSAVLSNDGMPQKLISTAAMQQTAVSTESRMKNRRPSVCMVS